MWSEQKYGSGWFSFFKQTNKSGWIGVRRMHLMVRSGFSSDPSPLAGLGEIGREKMGKKEKRGGKGEREKEERKKRKIIIV